MEREKTLSKKGGEMTQLANRPGKLNLQLHKKSTPDGQSDAPMGSLNAAPLFPFLIPRNWHSEVCCSQHWRKDIVIVASSHLQQALTATVASHFFCLTYRVFA